MVPGGSGGVKVGKTIFTCVYIRKKIFSRTSRPISIKLGTNHPFEREFYIVQIKD
jgi:hypothetical protein